MKINSDNCIGCGQCADVCENDAIKFDRHTAVIEFDLCKNCGKCKEVCPGECIYE